MIKANIITGLADLAEAAYVKWPKISADVLEDEDLSNAFKDDNGNFLSPWPKVRRDAFAAQWRVIAHRPDLDSGFSATVFERLNPKPGESRYVFAARGTAGVTSGSDTVLNVKPRHAD